jgi:excisionase family DNA binding protein
MKRISAPAKPAPVPAAEIMNVSDLARYLHCHQATIYRLLKERKIPAFKLSGGLRSHSDWRFFRSAIDEWIAQQEITFPPTAKGRKSKAS